MFTDAYNNALSLINYQVHDNLFLIYNRRFFVFQKLFPTCLFHAILMDARFLTQLAFFCLLANQETTNSVFMRVILCLK